MPNPRFFSKGSPWKKHCAQSHELGKKLKKILRKLKKIEENVENGKNVLAVIKGIFPIL